MIAKQDVFLTEDRKRAVLGGDKDARFLLARSGTELPQKLAEQYEGAVELLGGAKPAPAPSPAKEHAHREPPIEHREPHGKKNR